MGWGGRLGFLPLCPPPPPLTVSQILFMNRIQTAYIHMYIQMYGPMCLAHVKCLPPPPSLVETRQSYWVSLTLDIDWARTAASSSHCHQRLPSHPSYFYFCFHSYNFYSPLQLLTLYTTHQRSSSIHMHTCMHTHADVHIHMHAYTCRCAYTHACIHMQMCIYTCMHTHADVHIHMHRYTHTGTATVPPTRRRLSTLPSLRPAKAQFNIPLVTNYHRQVYYARQSLLSCSFKPYSYTAQQSKC